MAPKLFDAQLAAGEFAPALETALQNKAGKNKTGAANAPKGPGSFAAFDMLGESEAMQDALGTLYGRAEVTGTGRSIADLLGTGNGKASMVVEGGHVSALLM